MNLAQWDKKCFSKQVKICSVASFLVWLCLLLLYAIWNAVGEAFVLPDILFHLLCVVLLLFHVVCIVGSLIAGIYMLIFVSPKSTKKYWLHLIGNMSPMLFIFLMFGFHLPHVAQYLMLPITILMKDIVGLM